MFFTTQSTIDCFSIDDYDIELEVLLYMPGCTCIKFLHVVESSVGMKSAFQKHSE